jgi:zinc-ribbon domain
MKRRMLFSCAMAALLGWTMLAAAPRAFAQDPNQLSKLQVSVWPEYDKPTVLVMLDGTLADTKNLPRQVAVLIPSSAQIQVTTFTNPDGTYAVEQPSQSTNQGDGYARVTFTTNTAQYHVEYYDNLLRGSPDKTMDFVYKAAAPADQVTLQVQQPLKATNFSIDPSTQTTQNGSDGFTYYILQFPTLAAGQTISAQVKYTKTDPNPSVIATPAAAPASAPASAPAATPTSPWSNVFYVVALVVLGLVVVVGFFLWQRSREPVAAPVRSRSRPRHSAEHAATSAAAFCTQCGHGLGADDVFCPRCGTKRRMI